MLGFRSWVRYASAGVPRVSRIYALLARGRAWRRHPRDRAVTGRSRPCAYMPRVDRWLGPECGRNAEDLHHVEGATSDTFRTVAPDERIRNRSANRPQPKGRGSDT